MKLTLNFYLTLVSLILLITISSSLTYSHRSKAHNSKAKSALENLLEEREEGAPKKKAAPAVKKPPVKKGKKPAKGKAPAGGAKPKKDSKSSSDVETYLRIVKYIKEYALTASSKSNVNKKKKLAGALGPSYPKALRDKARKMHFDRKLWNHVMLFPSKVYKFCIFPYYELNYVKWCEEKYSSDKKKQINCQNTFCAVCCDNLQIMFRNQADNNVLGDLLKLSKSSGFAKIQTAATKDDIKECRAQCQVYYPVQFPKPNLPVPRDPKLGKFSNTPATSCADIKRWGAIDADSGPYWIQLSNKGITQVYCDMYSMQGGWTLFFNYMKFPNKKINIKKGRMPGNLKDNSHIDLKDGGFNEEQVKELRFFCTEKSDKKYFWHFRTGDPGTLSTAFSGDQSKMKLKDFKEEYSEMIFPGRALLWTRTLGQQQMEEDLDYLGANKNGGFWDTPFASRATAKFWTVKGSKKEPVFECGTKHQTANENNSAYTHHTVWFRGEPPSEDFARARYYNKEILKLRRRKIEEVQKKMNEK